MPELAMAKAGLAGLGFTLLAGLVVAVGRAQLTPDSPVAVQPDGVVRLVDQESLVGSLVYRSIVAASLRLGAGLHGVLVLHVFVATVAAVRLFSLGTALAGIPAGLAALALYALNPDQIRWHTYILSDSLYTSALILTVAAIRDLWLSPTKNRLILALLCAVCAGLMNVAGYLVVPLVMAAWLLRWNRTHAGRRVFTPVIVTMLLTLLMLLPLVRSTTLVPTIDQQSRDRGIVVRDYRESWLPMPVDRAEHNERQPSGLSYVIQHPRESIHLALLRVLAGVAHVRPFYTPRHNIAVIGVLVPVYTFAVLGWISARSDPLANILIMVIGIHLLVIALTYSDWDGRSLLFDLPLIGLLAARGLCWFPWSRRAVMVTVSLAGAAAFWHPVLLTSWAHQFRVDNPGPSDALVLLLGGGRDRAEKAAALYHVGLGRLVLVGADTDLDHNRKALMEEGVAADDVRSLGPTIGTREEAWRVRDYVEGHPEIRAITVVTTAFHTARADWIFRHVLEGSHVDVHTAASNDVRFCESNWYLNVDGIQAYSQEVCKFAYLIVCGTRKTSRN